MAASTALSCMTAGSGPLTSGESSPLDLKEGVIVHLFEWTYPQIALECQFLADHGFAGVQISPPTEHVVVDGQWWERYQPVSYQLISRSGDEKQLSDMLTQCNQLKVRVFADVVFNQMSGLTNRRGVGQSTFNPKDCDYPAVPYTKDDFHPDCSISSSYNDAKEVRNCRLLGMPDLDQSRDSVRQKIVAMMNHLIDIGIAGFRIDAARHMHPDDLSAIYKQLKDLNTRHGFPPKTKPLIYQEVIDLGHEVVRYEEYSPLGLVTDFRFGNELGRCFQGWNDLKWLNNFGSEWNLLPSDRGLVFIENHDSERSDNKNILIYKNSRAYKMAVVFMLAWGYGSPRLHSGYEFSSFDQGPPSKPQEISGNICFNGWLCQHRWRQLYNAVQFYNVVKGTEVTSWWDNGKNQIAFCRGDKGFVAFNLEKDYDLARTMQTCLPEGTYCDIISGEITSGKCSGNTIHVNNKGEAWISISKFDPQSSDDGVLAIHIQSKINSAA